MAVGGYTSFQQSNDKLKATASSVLSKEMQLLRVAEWKEAKRKEQCRRAQTKFQRRKREELQGLLGSVKRLKREIKRLETRKESLRKQQNQLVQRVTRFYSSLQTKVKEQHLPDVRNYEQTYGCTPALQVLADLQREEFDSIESLELHWRWYHSQFRQFELSITSNECLVAGEHVIVKATGNLLLEVAYEDTTLERKRQFIVCPVLQQFEFENGSQVVKRITSEVDLVGGASSTRGSFEPERILSILRYLSMNFCSNADERATM
ncbi:hypothetical protein PHYBOEH_004274 [Phytophthora boehmeriae]|uniref:Bzip transcription factor n=1 Tax=Phytophthora boehmeriae TaxID=109152 RepID=A0A8T1WMF2_9STRA|nr:hypothetical protein PHYBOEH_004274 [Phytophthora boehmeriae]